VNSAEGTVTNATGSRRQWPEDTLAGLAWCGGELLGLATMIGDQNDLHVWRSKRDAWLGRAAERIESHDAGAARSFRDVTRVERPQAALQPLHAGELDGLRAAIHFLRRLERALPSSGERASAERADAPVTH
jgi:hypothetical protein